MYKYIYIYHGHNLFDYFYVTVCILKRNDEISARENNTRNGINAVMYNFFAITMHMLNRTIKSLNSPKLNE